MKKMLTKIRKKGRSKAGETFTEVLASMVIISLASILLASMIAASARIITSSVKSYDRFVAQTNSLEKRATVEGKTDEGKDPGMVTGDGTVTINPNGAFGIEKVLKIAVKTYSISENDAKVLETYSVVGSEG